MPTLFVVATPIGNLEDVTLRALRVLREVGLIAAEDTRITRKLLLRHEIRTPLISYNEHNREERIPYLLARLRDVDVALVSDAGTPGIRDPGRELVMAAVQQGVPVVPVPGPSAVTTALAVSGLPADQFLFLGYLPRRGKERRRLLTSVASEPRTVVVFEAPHRIRASLKDLAATLGEQRQIVICRELTKVYEEIYRGTAGQATAHFSEPKGEFTLLISGADATQQETPADAEEVVEELRRLKSGGLSAREAVGAIAERHGLPRRRVYALWLEL
ncbi:MAG: 16S rRNA (cytidine(1402)-2'-O)-methyltransferase [Chloroflexi bacterium]|nr:16S rRNA (cytidine(1402)-2'-O)-methyltransferase [Chloroflexota bacterium]